MNLKNLNCYYSLTGDYDLNDKNIDWSNTILLDKHNNKMVLLGGLLEFKFTDISDDFMELVDDAFKQTALSQNGGVKLYNSLINVTDQIKDGLSEHIKNAFENLKEIQEQQTRNQNIFGSGMYGAAKAKDMEELLKNFKLYTDLVNTTLGSHEQKLAHLKEDGEFASAADVDKIKNDLAGVQSNLTDATGEIDDLKVKVAANEAAAKDAQDAADEVKETVTGLMGENFNEINKNYDTIKELADYVDKHGTEFAGIVETINGKEVEKDGEKVIEGGLVNEVADIKSDLKEVAEALGIGEQKPGEEKETLVDQINRIDEVVNGYVDGEDNEVPGLVDTVKEHTSDIEALKELVGHEAVVEDDVETEPATGLVKKVADLEKKVEETPENVVVYEENGNVELANGVAIAGKDSEGVANNLVKLTNYDTAEFGSVATAFNINAKEGTVTINDNKVVATTNDIEMVAMSALADLRAKLKTETPTDPEGTANTELLLSSAEAINNLSIANNPGTYKSVNIIGGSTDQAIKLAATDTVNIIGMELGAYYDEATNKTTGKNRIRISTPDLKVNNLKITDACNSYNILECDSSTPVKNVEVYNMNVPYSQITHNIVNVYCPANGAKIVISDCKFDINPENTNPLRLSNYLNSENVTVVLSNVEWTYNNYKAEKKNYTYAGLVLYQPAHTDNALKGDFTAVQTWNFVFKNCKFNGERITANNYNTAARAMYVYTNACMAPEAVGIKLSFE